MYYEEACHCCGKGITITGAYIANYSLVFCEDCGYDSEYCHGCCDP
ncbi:MAG: hypothetical protein GOVbin4206_38 [Prokaryotic dsDNA virus sp.]|nr:MAG: hypothetical protein GOVbin4206_38 [Prokaryotic dsDNA virus sp.]